MTTRSFTSKDRAILINYIGFVYHSLVNEGYSVESLLKGTGLQQANLMDPDYRCTSEQHKKFVLNAMAVTNDPQLGPPMAARYTPINIGLPALAAISSDKFSTALEVFKEYASLNFSIISFDYHQEGEQIIIDWQPSVSFKDEEYFVLGSCMVVCEACWKFLLGQDTPVTRYAELTVAEPEGWDSISNAIGFPVYFNRPHNRAVMPVAVMSQNVAGNDPILHQRMLRLCQKQKNESFYDKGLEAQVRNLVVSQHYARLQARQAAEALGMSERQLRRQLGESGTSYKKIRDSVLASRARELLAVPGLPVSTIAYDLGFCDPSNFARTFKRWTGKSPVEFRESIG